MKRPAPWLLAGARLRIGSNQFPSNDLLGFAVRASHAFLVAAAE
jgi:hypothetical protein